MSLKVNGVELVVVTLTRPLAQEWLDSMGVNRNLRDAKVSQFTRDWRSGDWHELGEPFARFDREGRLRDGQHRINSFLQSGKRSTEVLVARGLTEEAIAVVDTGTSRKFSDVLKMKGHKYNVALAGTIRWCAQYDDGTLATNSKSWIPASHDVLFSYLERNKGIEESVKKVTLAAGGGGRNNFRLPISTLAGLHFIATRGGEAEKADAFLEEIKTGANLTETSPTLALRDYMIRLMDAAKRSRPLPLVVSAHIIKAWNAYITDTPVRFLKWSSNEAFPTIKTRGAAAGAA